MVLLSNWSGWSCGLFGLGGLGDILWSGRSFDLSVRDVATRDVKIILLKHSIWVSRQQFFLA